MESERPPRLVVLSGAGVSAESGLQTFRDSDGLWENHAVTEVATPAAWEADPERVARFYDQRRRQVRAAAPNPAHLAIAALEAAFEVDVITQNIDDLHERAGSSRVLHLHGEILKARSSVDPTVVRTLDGDLPRQERCPKGGRWRPHVVWFGEEVPEMARAEPLVARADLLLVIGTSLVVYPAASLVQWAGPEVPIHLVDPAAPSLNHPQLHLHQATAAAVMPTLAAEWLRDPQAAWR